MVYQSVRIVRLERSTQGGYPGYLFGFQSSDHEEFWDFVGTLKDVIPSWGRKWLPNAPGGRCWWIDAEYISLLSEYVPGLDARLGALGANAGRGGGQSSSRQQGGSGSSSSSSTSQRYDGTPVKIRDAFTTLYLLPAAPPSVVRGAFRALAKVAHPDVAGGDTKTMQALNGAYELALDWSEQMRQQSSGKSA